MIPLTDETLYDYDDEYPDLPTVSHEFMNKGDLTVRYTGFLSRDRRQESTLEISEITIDSIRILDIEIPSEILPSDLVTRLLEYGEEEFANL